MELTLSDLPLLVMLSQVYCAPLLAFEPLLIDGESWLSASICGISDKIHRVTLESACFEAEEE